MRNDWMVSTEDINDIFYTKNETVENVKENFDMRRYYGSEGYDIEINGISERCLVQTSSNPLRELNDFRKISCPITADVKRGYYVKYEDSFWIIDTNVVNVDGAYLFARITRCQYLLRWQNRTGDIVERWGYSMDETKYSSGKTGNSNISVPDNQYGLLVPIDAETKRLKRGTRVSFDFDDIEEPDIYELNNRKVMLKEGLILLSFSIVAFNKDTDKHITLPDGNRVWICDYHSPTDVPEPNPDPGDETPVLSASISGGSTLRYGRAKTWTVAFKDKDGNEVTDCDFKWKVMSDFEIAQTVNTNKIQLRVDNEDCIGSSFLLQVINSANHEVLSNIEITIIEGF